MLLQNQVSCFQVPHWNEDVATDTLFSDILAYDDGIPGYGGCTMAQIHTKITSHFTKVYPVSSKSQIPDTLCDLLHNQGAPNNIMSDCAKAQQSNAFKEILHHYHIGEYFSECYQQSQTQLNATFKMSKKMSTLSWIGQAQHLNFGSYVPCLWYTYEMFWLLNLLGTFAKSKEKLG